MLQYHFWTSGLFKKQFIQQTSLAYAAGAAWQRCSGASCKLKHARSVSFKCTGGKTSSKKTRGAMSWLKTDHPRCFTRLMKASRATSRRCTARSALRGAKLSMHANNASKSCSRYTKSAPMTKSGGRPIAWRTLAASAALPQRSADTYGRNTSSWEKLAATLYSSIWSSHGTSVRVTNAPPLARTRPGNPQPAPSSTTCKPCGCHVLK
mmetsp:Transcript_61628/g.135001  ORF Transcript_61628/g.135001 Transcript_61628/m.135001 type:complete len:208 (-) Transcript_61628:387-1010(-)